MNADGSIVRPVKLSLAARDAASRAVARRRNRGSVHAKWPRLMLRWRRRSPRPTHVAAGRKMIATHAYWFLQFHLHFTGRATQPVPQRSSSDAPRRAAVRPLLLFGRRHEVFVRARAVTPVAPHRLPRAAHGLPAGQTRASGMQSFAMEKTLQVGRSPMSMAVSLPHRRLGMPPSFERTPNFHRRAAREQAMLIDPIRPTRRESKGSRLSIFRPADMLLPEAVARPPSRASHRPADLIWRTTPHTAAAVLDRETRPAAHVPPRLVPLAARPVPDTSLVDAHKDRPPVLSAASVDARLLDRLTDDVIRRVERRVRIERERRGL